MLLIQRSILVGLTMSRMHLLQAYTYIRVHHQAHTPPPGCTTRHIQTLRLLGHAVPTVRHVVCQYLCATVTCAVMQIAQSDRTLFEY